MRRNLLSAWLWAFMTLACAGLSIDVHIKIQSAVTGAPPVTVNIIPSSPQVEASPIAPTITLTPTLAAPFASTLTATLLPPTPAPFFPDGRPFYVDETRMFSETIGWGLAQGHLLHTRDGGKNWRDVRPLSGVYIFSDNVFFLDGETAWVGTIEAHSTTFWHTRDGGLTWKRETVLDVNSLDTSPCGPLTFDTVASAKMFFLDIARGWLIITASDHVHSAFDVSLFFATKTGGLTWDLISTASPDCSSSGSPDGMKQVLFWNSAEGWGAFASRRYDDYPNYELPYIGGWEIYHTLNGGESWEKALLPEPPGLLEEIARQQAEHVRCNALKLYPFAQGIFGARLVCFIPPNQSLAYYYLTRDDGLSWNAWQTETGKLAYTPLFDEAFHYNFLSGRMTGWRFMRQEEYGILQQTSDDGQTWVDLGKAEWLWARFDFISERIGWVSAPDFEGHTNLYFTLDGGRTWKKLTPMLVAKP